MGIFSSMYTKEGPGVPKNAPQKKGFKRFFEIFGRDHGMLWRTGMLVSLCFLPCILFVIFGFIGRQYLGFLLIGAVGYLLSSLLVGPALCGMFSIVVTCVRDEPCYMMHVFKKAWKDNRKQAIPAGVLQMLLLGSEIFMAIYYLTSGENNYMMMALVFFCLLVVTTCSMLVFLQMLFLNLSMLGILKNSLLMMFGFAKRTLPAGVITLFFYSAAVLLIPWPILTLLFFLGIPAFVCVIQVMWLWPTMEKAFQISERQAEKKTEAVQSELPQ